MAAEDYLPFGVDGFEYPNRDEFIEPPPGYRISASEFYRIKRELNRRLNKGNNKMKKINKKNINKFYVAANHIASSIANGNNSDWSHKTIEQAIAHGKSIMESEDRDCVVLVKIIKVLRRASTPIIVEDVK